MYILTAKHSPSTDRIRYTIERRGYGIVFASEDYNAVREELSRIALDDPDQLLDRASSGEVEFLAASVGPYDTKS